MLPLHPFWNVLRCSGHQEHGFACSASLCLLHYRLEHGQTVLLLVLSPTQQCSLGFFPHSTWGGHMFFFTSEFFIFIFAVGCPALWGQLNIGSSYISIKVNLGGTDWLQNSGWISPSLGSSKRMAQLGDSAHPGWLFIMEWPWYHQWASGTS